MNVNNTAIWCLQSVDGADPHMSVVGSTFENVYDLGFVQTNSFKFSGNTCKNCGTGSAHCYKGCDIEKTNCSWQLNKS